MSAGVPDSFKVDFAKYGIDLIQQALGRMLSQFWPAPVMRAFVEALVKAGPQWAYDEILKQQEANSLYVAEGFNLEAIGRIVGQSRIPYQYDDSTWFAFDRAGQGFEQAPCWVKNASMAGNTPAQDPQYRRMILARIACNFNRFSSTPELVYLVRFVTGETVGWRRVGPMECELYVGTGISRSNFDVLTRFVTTTACDDIPSIPYPATLSLSKAVFTPDNSFIFDRADGHQFDAGLCAVGVPLR